MDGFGSAVLQTNTWSCGATALRNALLAYGEVLDAPRIARLSGTTRRRGTNENGLRRAARALGYGLPHHPVGTALLARAVMLNRLTAGTPMLMCVDRGPDGPWQHWVAVVEGDARKVRVLDSSRPGPVDRTYTWLQFLQRAIALPDLRTVRYDLYPVVKT